MSSALDLTALQNVIALLEDVLKLETDLSSSTSEAVSASLRNALRSAVVKNFEFVFGLSVKFTRRRLEIDLPDLVIDDLSYRALMRTAAEHGVVDDVLAWFQYRELRSITAHTYQLAKAQEVGRCAPQLLKDAKLLLQPLEARNDDG